jgi:hypothetical protein
VQASIFGVVAQLQGADVPPASLRVGLSNDHELLCRALWRGGYQRRFMQPRGDAIGDLPITNDGPVECRLLGPAAEVDPCGDAAGWRFILDTAPDLLVVQAVQDAH